MKVNLPITDKECNLKEGENLITTTSLKGSITYFNKSFQKISGFDDNELQGKNHNIVRHPDMPPAAFKDLWETIKNHQSWMGIVKNRCKNGDHYYVDAFVTPIMEKGKIVEYQSVRRTPDRKCVDRAEKIYKRIQSGKTPFRPWFQFSFTSKITMGMSIIILSCLSFLLWAGQISWVYAGITLILGLGLSYGVTRVIAAPLVKLETKARSIYDNDLACMIYEGSINEVSRVSLAIRKRDLEINSIVARLDDSVEKLNTIVSHQSDIARELTESATGQQNEIGQLSISINEMSSTIQEVARSTAEGASAAQQADENVSIGRQEVSSTIQVVKKVFDEVNQAAKVVRKLQVDSESIGAVLDVICGVAEQTNLLALNAAIEAARAGEQGRGFAVVADEVRSLASRTQQSTQEIQQTILSIQEGARNAVCAMEDGCKRVDYSLTQAKKAGVSLETINEVVRNITYMNIQVATATEEQSLVSEEINRNVSNISDTSDLSVSLNIRSEKTVDQLLLFSKRLRSLILQFREK